MGIPKHTSEENLLTSRKMPFLTWLIMTLTTKSNLSISKAVSVGRCMRILTSVAISFFSDLKSTRVLSISKLYLKRLHLYKELLAEDLHIYEFHESAVTFI